MLINFTNHPSHLWNEIQTKSALEYGPIEDMPFPSVDPTFTTEEVKQLAQKYFTKIEKKYPKAVLVQGEMTLCYHIVSLLKKANIKVLCACSQRVSTEETDADGNTVKKSLFQFIQFREY